jgi:hypothetical protein
VLAASLTYALTDFGFVDSISALGLIYFSSNEGRESFEKAEGWRLVATMSRLKNQNKHKNCLFLPYFKG